MVMLDFTGVEEASDIKKKLKEGKYLVQITKAEEDQKQGGKPYWKFEYTIKQGQFKGEKQTEVISFIGKDDKATKILLSRIKRMYSRILNIKLDGQSTCNPLQFLNSVCMIEIVQKWQEAKDSFSAGYKAEVKFACHSAATDYKDEFDEQLSNCAAYQAQLDNKDNGAEEAATTKVEGFDAF